MSSATSPESERLQNSLQTQSTQGAKGMNPEQISLVQGSFTQVTPIADQAADLFYARLFQLDPALRGMFKNDMAEQKHKLIAMLIFTVNNLTQPEELFPAIQELGRRHTGYGVKNRHYETLGAALLWTFEKALGEEFTPEVKAAWTAVYNLLATTMQQAAAEGLSSATDSDHQEP
jgi:hemoglobin-like flavoprotein